MLLVIDVGNSNTVLGLYRGELLSQTFRIQTLKNRTSDELGALLKNLFALEGITGGVSGAIISCVVPDLLHSLVQTVRRYFDTDPLVVGPGIRTSMPILLDNPREVGADRIVNAIAAYDQVRGACVVVDFGTATTFDCVSPRGEYLGGAISPGYQISAEALFQRTSKLPRVELAKPKRVIGKNTIHCMQSGLFYGYVSLVDGVVTRILAEMELPERPPVLATGGLASTIAGASGTIDRVDDDLTLKGLRLLFERNG